MGDPFLHNDPRQMPYPGSPASIMPTGVDSAFWMASSSPSPPASSIVSGVHGMYPNSPLESPIYYYQQVGDAESRADGGGDQRGQERRGRAGKKVFTALILLLSCRFIRAVDQQFHRRLLGALKSCDALDAFCLALRTWLYDLR